MGFKQYVDGATITFKYPYKGSKREKTLSLAEYRKLIDQSILSYDKKILKSKLDTSSDIPIFCEDQKKFFMLNLKNGKCKEVKSREDKVSFGVLFNALLREAKNAQKEEVLESLKSLKLAWDAPGEIYVTK